MPKQHYVKKFNRRLTQIKAEKSALIYEICGSFLFPIMSITFEATTAALPQALAESVEDYLAFCAARNERPAGGALCRSFFFNALNETI
jgi:hypothetical protein